MGFMSMFIYSQFFITPQYPIESYEGQTIIVTGSNSGLGREAAHHFVRLGAAKVIIAVRDLEAGGKAKEFIETSTKRPGICEVWKLDLSSYDSVKAFAARTLGLPRLDILLENAGISTETFALTEGHEKNVTINVISTFLLGLLVLPKLEATGKEFPTSSPHLTIVTSETHWWTQFPESKAENIFAALDDEKTANMTLRYPTSKLLEILAVREFAPRIAKSGVILNMLNPGLCHSELERELGWGSWFGKLIFARTTEVGSRSLLAAAAAGKESHGAYMSNGKVDNEALSPWVRSDEGVTAQQKVWKELSEILEKIQPGITAKF